MSGPLALLVDALACYRLTRLVTRDEITRSLRSHVASSGPEQFATLLNCAWCVSWWVACVVAAARRLEPKTWSPVAEALALSAFVGLVAENLD